MTSTFRVQPPSFRPQPPLNLMNSPVAAQPTSRLQRGPTGLIILAWMGVGMLVGILFLAWLGTPRFEPAIGQALTQLELKPLIYAERPLSEHDLQGKITLLHFWGTWCAPCRKEFPEFAQLAERLRGLPDVQVIAVSSSQGPEYNLDELKERTLQFMQEHQAEVPTYADPAGLTRGQVMLLLPETTLPYPSTLILNRQGKVAGLWLGMQAQGLDQVAKEVELLRSQP